MKYLKQIGKAILVMTIFLITSTFLITLLNYFNIIGSGFLSILKIAIIIITLFIGGYLIGKESSKKGWLEGLKLSLIFTIILILFSILGFGNKLEFKHILYYGILIISCMFGSMLGINKSNQKN